VLWGRGQRAIRAGPCRAAPAGLQLGRQPSITCFQYSHRYEENQARPPARRCVGCASLALGRARLAPSPSYTLPEQAAHEAPPPPNHLFRWAKATTHRLKHYTGFIGVAPMPAAVRALRRLRAREHRRALLHLALGMVGSARVAQSHTGAQQVEECLWGTAAGFVLPIDASPTPLQLFFSDACGTPSRHQQQGRGRRGSQRCSRGRASLRGRADSQPSCADASP
jgi:hypothetical protein